MSGTSMVEQQRSTTVAAMDECDVKKGTEHVID